MVEDATQPSLAEIKTRLANISPQLPILRPGEFCERDDFLDTLSPVVVELMAKVSALEPSQFQAQMCSVRAEAELMRSIRFKSAISLDSAIALGSVAIKYAYKDDQQRGIIISMFGRALRRRWQLSKEDNHLDDAIYYFLKTIEFEPLDEVNRPLHYDDLGGALRERYIRRHDESDFKDSRQAFEEACGYDFDAKPAFLTELGRLFMDKASSLQGQEKQAWLEDSLKKHLEAISSVTPAFCGSMLFIYTNLAAAYLELYGAIDETILTRKFKGGVEEIIQPTGKMWMFHHALGVTFGERYFTHSRPSDARTSITLLKAALQESVDHQMTALILAKVLRLFGTAVGSQEMLSEAFQLYDGIIRSTGEYNFQLIPQLEAAALALISRYELGGQIDDLQNAISFTERGLSSPLLANTDKWRFQRLLGVQLGYRFKALEDRKDMESAISYLKAVLDTPGLEEKEQASTLSEYGKVLFLNYKDLHKEEDLNQAEESFKTAIEIWGQEHEDVPATFNDLGNAMLIRFENTGHSEHLQQCIDYFLEGLGALQKFPLLVKRQKHMFFAGLGNAFFVKYEVWDQVADLNQSIFYYQEAVKNTRPTDVQLSLRNGRLAYALQQKFRVTQDKKILLRSQEILKSVLTSPNAWLPPPSIAFLQNFLGISYLHAFDSSNDISFMDLAAECFQAAVDSGCTQPSLLNPPIINLTRTLTGKYENTKRSEDLQKAMKGLMMIEMVTKHPGSRELRGLFDTFAKLCAMAYDIEKVQKFALVGLEYYLLVANDTSGFPERRISASMEASRLTYEVMNDPVNARDILLNVLDLLPGAILMGTNRGDQLRAARVVSALPSFIISFSLAAGDEAAEALKVFEQCRSVVWNRLLDLKTDLTDLLEKHPELADRFEQARERLNRTRPQTIVTEDSARAQLHQHNMALEYNKVVRLIRQQEGFEHFMLLDAHAHLLELASQGPVIVLNATVYRGDAIMITSEGTSSMTLPAFTFEKCAEYSAFLKYALSSMTSDFEAASALMTSVLKWLWEAAARPILDKLGITGTRDPNQKLPRVWWVVNGWTSILPIHAAGDHARALGTSEPCSVMDRAVSSYIPTLRVLDYVRKCASNRASTPRQPLKTPALLIKMPETPNDQELPNVDVEIAAVEAILKNISEVTILNRPMRRDVLPKLAASSMAHFACHGVADKQDPSKSKLKLEDWKEFPLDVRAILGLSRSAAASDPLSLTFVYLSACETAASKGLKMQNESVHLSAAFQMAGVPYTVASLWSIEDRVSATIAKDFYEVLTLGDGAHQSCEEVIEFGRTAEALHEAIVKARNNGVDALLWGAFVHSGA